MMNVLIISNNCFSESGAGGRTLSQLFDESLDYSLFQFFISQETPEANTHLKSFFRFTDSDALHSILKSTVQKEGANLELQSTKKPKKTLFMYFIRTIVWKMSHWKKSGLVKWAKEIKPDLIFFANTDSLFLYDIAMYLQKIIKCPIITYNTERYVLNKKCYIYQSRFSKCLYPIWHLMMKGKYRKFMELSSFDIYNSEKLRDLMVAKYPNNNAVIYSSTSISIKEASDSVFGIPTFLYAGNLGLNRYKSLILFADYLQGIDKKLTLDVYGKANDVHIIELLKKVKGINYKGFLDYQSLVQLYPKYSFLLHAESFEKNIYSTIDCGFSTKIPDCLASGTCLIAFAPKEFCFMEYLSNNKCAFIINSPNQLYLLNQLLKNSSLKKTIIESAQTICKENHQRKKVAELVYNIMYSVLRKG